MVLKALDHVQNCYTWEHGQVIYQLVRKEFDQGRKVTLSFEGVRDVPSSFVNAALISLLEDYSYDFIRSHLIIVDVTKQISDMIKRRFLFEINSAA